MDSASPQSADLDGLLGSEEAAGQAQPSNVIECFEDLWREADGQRVELEKAEFARALLALGEKHNYGLSPGTIATPQQRTGFYRALQLRELALTQACAFGRDAAWGEFLARFKEPLMRAAIAITGSASLGRDLADSLYSELFGLTERDGQRRSPLTSYSGRGSLMGWLRTILAQRHVDHHRRTHQETPLESDDFAAATSATNPAPEILTRLERSLTAVLHKLGPEERFLLSAWFLDRRTLLEISKLLRVHEATVSRKLKRLTSELHTNLLKDLQKSGMSKRAADEALGADPRDLNINLRNLLQSSQSSPFYEQAIIPDTPTEPKQA